MIPILFDKSATEFTSNGQGRLSDTISCTVLEKLNGEYELEMVYPITGAHFSEIGMQSIIVAPHDDSGDLQPFVVYKVTKPLNGKVSVYAQHISYRLNNIPAMPFSIEASSSACAFTLTGLKSHAAEDCPFEFWTNVTTASSYTQTIPSAIRQRLGGVEGSVLDQFGGEYEWDNFTVKLHKKRGSNSGVVLKYGKNITDITQEEYISSTITGVVPYWSDMSNDEVVILPEKAVYSSHADKYPFHLTTPLDLSSKWEEAPSVETLRTAAEAYINQSGMGIPRVSIELSFVALWQTKEYENIAPLESVLLGDTVNVYFETLDIESEARVVATQYNVLNDRYDSIQIGNIKSTFASTVNDMNAGTLQEIDTKIVQAGTAINNATKWLTTAGGYVLAIKNDDGSWRELVFSSSTDIEAESTNILRINNNGIGFSTNGLNGAYKNAWTIDGNLVADFIHGGTLTLGGNGNTNGWLKILNASGQQIGKWDKDGISITAGSINVANKFIVDTNGNLTATGATITGNLKVSSDMTVGGGSNSYTGNDLKSAIEAVSKRLSNVASADDLGDKRSFNGLHYLFNKLLDKDISPGDLDSKYT